MNIYIPEQLISLMPIAVAFLLSFSLLSLVLIKQGLNFNNPVIIGFIGIISLSSWWSFTYFFRAIADNEQDLILWLYIEYIPHIAIGLAWLFFSLLFVHQGKIIKKYGLFIAIPPLASFILMLSNDYHYLFFSEISIEKISYGIFWYFPHLAISYLYILIGLILLLRYFFQKKNKIERRRTFITILGAFTPLLGNIVDSFLVKTNIFDIKIDLTPVFFTFSNIFFAIALLKYRLFSLKPVLYNELMKSIQGGVIIFDFNNRLLELNPIAEKLLGKKKSELVGADINYICQRVKCQNDKIKKLVLLNKEVNNASAKLLYPEEKYISFSISLVKNKHGEVVSKVIVLNDITELTRHHQEIAQMNAKLEKNSEELQLKNRDLNKSKLALMNLMEDLQSSSKKLKKLNLKLKNVDEMRKEFVSHTAHELRTPLNSLRWSLEMLINEDVGRINRSQRELLDQLYRSNLRLLGLVEDLLEVSRIDQDRFKVDIKECEIDKLIDQVLGELSIKIREKNIKINWAKPKQLPKIKADCDRVLQVLINIISNAVKYSENNDSISIKIEKLNQIVPEDILEYKKKIKCSCLNHIGKHQRYLLCSIADTGIGIPKSEQQKMFSRFFRASNALSSEEQGTGLGMTITKKIIELHEGSIWFESQEGQGTTFYFTIPAK